MLDASGGIAPFCDATGQFMPLLCTMNCTVAPEEARQRHPDLVHPNLHTVGIPQLSAGHPCATLRACRWSLNTLVFSQG